MLYLIIFIGLLFVGVGSILTVKNAKYILSGYNTMTSEERKHFDIESYVPFFRKFHHQLGTSFIFLGAISLYLLGEKISGLFVGVYPVLAYIYFLVSSMQYSSEKYKLVNKIAVGIMILTLLFVVYLFYMEWF